ncbi:hypothetical protein [Stenotrophomonas sp. PS02300]|uniref:hypothetical protein n=1 Tax=Stenotrophomonas sp. PS02300 TaxID=2991426 RepID=UPI002499EF17|nr:hypothetical protein [Stenotrophomonas sp. PS02300]
MTYKKEEAEEALFNYYWKWHGESSQPGSPGKHRRLRERGEGAKWGQIKGAILEQVVASKDVAQQGDHRGAGHEEHKGLPLAAAAGLLNVGSRALRDLIWEDHIRRALLDNAKNPKQVEEVAKALELTVEQCTKLKAEKERSEIPGFPLGTAHESEWWKVRLKADAKALSDLKATAKSIAAAKRRSLLLRHARKVLEKSKVLQKSTVGQKSRVRPGILIQWADQHTDLQSWRSSRDDNVTLGGTLSQVIEYLQVTMEGKLVIYTTLPKHGGQPEVVSFNAGGALGVREMRRRLLQAGLVELDKRGNLLKLETQESTVAEAITMPWAKPDVRNALAEAYVDTLKHYSQWLAEHASASALAANALNDQAKGEGQTVSEASMLNQRRAKALSEEKEAMAWSSQARGAALAALLPAASNERSYIRRRF